MADDPEKLREAEQNLIESSRLYDEAVQAYTKIHPGAAFAGLAIPQTASDLLEADRIRIKNRTALMLLELGSHTLVLVLSLGSIYLTGWVLQTLLGPNPKFFDFIPIHWIIDAADIAVIGKFIWETMKSFRK
ncbi:MAG: hypothetical protein AABO41_19410 [Acidobacteriota bacterium]